MRIVQRGDKYFIRDREVDAKTMQYIKSLVIPPNYKNVVVFFTKNPKILYQGYDSKGRLQQKYSAAWVKKATKKKFCALLDLATKFEQIKKVSRIQMMDELHTKNKMIAIIIRIVMICYFRIGNRKYQELYGSFGAMNIQKKHITLGKTMTISFTGKKKVFNTCEVCDPVLISEIKKIMAMRADDEMMFQWVDRGVKIPVRAIDINIWLRQFGDITSKAFRTYDANILLIIYLNSIPLPSTVAQRKKVVVSALKEVSAKIHNTPAVLRKNYTQTGIIDMYINKPRTYAKWFSKRDPRAAFVGYLRNYCK